jgi:hypothetical protein
VPHAAARPGRGGHEPAGETTVALGRRDLDAELGAAGQTAAEQHEPAPARVLEHAQFAPPPARAVHAGVGARLDLSHRHVAVDAAGQPREHDVEAARREAAALPASHASTPGASGPFKSPGSSFRRSGQA